MRAAASAVVRCRGTVCARWDGHRNRQPCENGDDLAQTEEVLRDLRQVVLGR